MGKFKQYWIIIILALLVLGASFYWYQWRPSQIRKECAQTSEDKWNEKKDAFEIDNTENARGYYDFYYYSCLHKKGLSE